jgi:hypothetical protein
MNTLTKVAVALPALALLSACATTAPTTPNKTSASESVTDVAYDRMAPAPYLLHHPRKTVNQQKTSNAKRYLA